MKRILSLLLCAALVLGLLSACASQGDTPSPPESEPTPSQSEPSPAQPEEPEPPADPAEKLSARDIVEAVYLSLVENAGGMAGMYITDSEYYFKKQYESTVAEEDYESAGVISGSSRYLTVLRCVDEDAASRVEKTLQSYADEEQARWEDFPDMRNPSAVYRQGQYVGLFICPGPEQARDAFLSVLATGERAGRTAPVTESPAFELHDLLFRLLAEGGACPNWRDVSGKSWTHSDSDYAQMDIASTFGVTPRQYERCTYAYWEPEGEYQGASSSHQLVLFQTAGEEEAKALLPVLERGLEARCESLRAQLAYETALFPNPDPEGQVAERLAQEAHALERLETTQLTQAGRYAALLVCDDPAQVAVSLRKFTASADTEGFFKRYMNSETGPVEYEYDPNYPGRERFNPPNEEDMSIYDTSAILSAWEKGDPAGLSGYDREIYDAAQEVLDEIITDGMSDLEKETAIYTWITQNVGYGWSHMDILSETSREAYTPYGGLVNRKAICLGYATTFQLLMDLLDVECLTVVGAAVHNAGDHAWNMVRLNGNWYGVDVAWDASGQEAACEDYEWQYFNITSDKLAELHQWDYANTPEAVTEGNGR